MNAQRRTALTSFGEPTAREPVVGGAADLARAGRPRSLVRAFGEIRRRTFGFDVFLAHAWGDGHVLARRLHQALTRRRRQWRRGRPRLNCFLDDEEMIPGDLMPDHIARALKGSEILVVLLTPEAFVSEWVAREIEQFLARKRDRGIFAVRFDHAPVDTLAVLRRTYEECLAGPPLPAPALVSDQQVEALADQIALRRGWLTTRRQALAVLAAGAASVVGAGFWLASAAVEAERRRKAADDMRRLEGWLARGNHAAAEHRHLDAEVAHAQAVELGSTLALSRYHASAGARRLVPYRALNLPEGEVLQYAGGHRGRTIAVTFSGAEGRSTIHDGDSVVRPNRQWSHPPTVLFDDARVIFRSGDHLFGIDLGNADRTWECVVPGAVDVRLIGKTVVAVRNQSDDGRVRILSAEFGGGPPAEYTIGMAGLVLSLKLSDGSGDLLVAARSSFRPDSQMSLDRYVRADGWRKLSLHTFGLPALRSVGDEPITVHSIESSPLGRTVCMTYDRYDFQTKLSSPRHLMVRPDPTRNRTAEDADNAWRKMIPLDGGHNWAAALHKNDSLETRLFHDMVIRRDPRLTISSGVTDACLWALNPARPCLLAVGRRGPLMVYDVSRLDVHAVCRLDWPADRAGDDDLPGVSTTPDGSLVTVVHGRAVYWWRQSDPPAEPATPPSAAAVEREVGISWTDGEDGVRPVARAFSYPREPSVRVADP